jgi:hypothetical protein
MSVSDDAIPDLEKTDTSPTSTDVSQQPVEFDEPSTSRAEETLDEPKTGGGTFDVAYQFAPTSSAWGVGKNDIVTMAPEEDEDSTALELMEAPCSLDLESDDDDDFEIEVLEETDEVIRIQLRVDEDAISRITIIDAKAGEKEWVGKGERSKKKKKGKKGKKKDR